MKALILKMYGLSESVLRKKLRDINVQGVDFEVLSHPKGVDLTILVEGDGEKVTGETLGAIEKKLRRMFPGCIFGVNGEKMEKAVATILISKEKTIAVAESCTGGLISHWLTNIPGSSKYFKEGIIAYSNETKVDLLRVSAETLTRFGAVSREVVEAMAKGARELAKTDIGLASSGIAGPEGGTAEKPVGLICIGLADGEKVISEEHHFGGGRELIKIQASQAALDLVRRNLQ